MSTKELEELRQTAEGAEPETVAAAARLLSASRSGEDQALLAARTLAWITQGVETLDPASVREALASPDGEEAITEMIESIVLGRSKESPMVKARLCGVHRRLELLEAEGGWMSAADAARQLDRGRTAVDKRRERGTILALPKSGEYVYPVWQFDDTTRDGLLPGFKEVLASFGVESSWMRAEFLLAHHEELGGARPIDALRAGEVHRVRQLAGSYGEQGAR